MVPDALLGFTDVVTSSPLDASSPASVAVDVIWTCSWDPSFNCNALCYRTADNLYIWRDFSYNGADVSLELTALAGGALPSTGESTTDPTIGSPANPLALPGNDQRRHPSSDGH